jgi:hypothetical protein
MAYSKMDRCRSHPTTSGFLPRRDTVFFPASMLPSFAEPRTYFRVRPSRIFGKDRYAQATWAVDWPHIKSCTTAIDLISTVTTVTMQGPQKALSLPWVKLWLFSRLCWRNNDRWVITIYSISVSLFDDRVTRLAHSLCDLPRLLGLFLTCELRRKSRTPNRLGRKRYQFNNLCIDHLVHSFGGSDVIEIIY